MGVAVSVSTSTLSFSVFRRSLWRTPKRCSSSTMSSPRSLNFTSSERSRWVPMTMSTSPFAMRCTSAASSFVLRKRDNTSMRTG